MATKPEAVNTSIEVTFTSNKETENCIRMGATDKNADAFGAIYIRKDAFPEGCTDAIVTITFKEN
jgi:hypothetical protein